MDTFNTYFVGIIIREKMIRMCMRLRLYTILPVTENFRIRSLAKRSVTFL